MASTNVWNLKFVAGNPEHFTKIRTAADSPMPRAEALRQAKRLDDRWRVWVEHASREEKIFESTAEKQWAS